MLDNLALAGGQLSTSALISSWMLTISVTVSMVSALAACACCACKRKGKGVEDDAPYELGPRGDVKALRYSSKSSPGKTKVTTGHQPPNEAPLISGTNNSNPSGMFRALPSLPRSPRSGKPVAVAESNPTEVVVHSPSNPYEVTPLTRDSSMSELYASVDKPTSPRHISATTRDYVVRPDGGYAGINKTETTSTTVTTVEERYSKKEKTPGGTADVREMYTAIPPSSARRGSQNGMTPDKPDGPTMVQPQAGVHRPLANERHQYEYPVFEGRKTVPTAADPMYSRIDDQPDSAPKHDALYSGSTGSEDPYASIASNVGGNQNKENRRQGKDEPWYAKVGESTEPSGSSTDPPYSTVPSTSARRSDFNSPEASSQPTYSAVNKPAVHQSRHGPTTSSSAASPESSSSSYPGNVDASGYSVVGEAAGNDGASDEPGVHREPSYRYITVRESLGVLRERMAAQAREQENQPWQPSDGQGNYYSSIGSENGYETVPGTETPQHLYEDITQLNREIANVTTEDPYAVIADKTQSADDRPTAPSASANRGEPSSSQSHDRSSTSDEKRPDSISSTSNIPDPPRPPTSPIPGRDLPYPKSPQKPGSSNGSRPSTSEDPAAKTAGSTTPFLEATDWTQSYNKEGDTGTANKPLQNSHDGQQQVGHQRDPKSDVRVNGRSPQGPDEGRTAEKAAFFEATDWTPSYNREGDAGAANKPLQHSQDVQQVGHQRDPKSDFRVNGQAPQGTNDGRTAEKAAFLDDALERSGSIPTDSQLDRSISLSDDGSDAVKSGSGHAIDVTQPFQGRPNQSDITEDPGYESIVCSQVSDKPDLSLTGSPIGLSTPPIHESDQWFDASEPETPEITPGTQKSVFPMTDLDQPAPLSSTPKKSGAARIVKPEYVPDPNLKQPPINEIKDWTGKRVERRPQPDVHQSTPQPADNRNIADLAIPASDDANRRNISDSSASVETVIDGVDSYRNNDVFVMAENGRNGSATGNDRVAAGHPVKTANGNGRSGALASHDQHHPADSWAKTAVAPGRNDKQKTPVTFDDRPVGSAAGQPVKPANGSDTSRAPASHDQQHPADSSAKTAVAPGRNDRQKTPVTFDERPIGSAAKTAASGQPKPTTQPLSNADRLRGAAPANRSQSPVISSPRTAKRDPPTATVASPSTARRLAGHYQGPSDRLLGGPAQQHSAVVTPSSMGKKVDRSPVRGIAGRHDRDAAPPPPPLSARSRELQRTPPQSPVVAGRTDGSQQDPHYARMSPPKSLASATSGYYSESARPGSSPPRQFASAYRDVPTGIVPRESMSIEIHGRQPNSPDSCFSTVPTRSLQSPSSDLRSPSPSSSARPPSSSGFGTSRPSTALSTPTKTVDETSRQQPRQLVDTFDTRPQRESIDHKFAPTGGGFGGGGGGGGSTGFGAGTPGSGRLPSSAATTPAKSSRPDIQQPNIFGADGLPTGPASAQPDQDAQHRWLDRKCAARPAESDFVDPMDLYASAQQKARAKKSGGGGGAEAACYCHSPVADDLLEAVLMNNLYNMENAEVIAF